nr:glucosamine-6-phosphate isomerase [Prolixibacteraceae bacterium]
ETQLEVLQQESLYKIDNWCMHYEEKIRQLGGIGFFLGGIGPDGHIAFNTRGSDHNSTTRLTATNFETQAASASDLGGIEISRNRLVITIGLGTITFNPKGVALIFAAGEAKASIVKNAIENEANIIYPATVLYRLPNARFYLTEGAGYLLNDSQQKYYHKSDWTFEKTERVIYELCEKINKYAHHLTLNDLKNDQFARLIPNLSLDVVNEVVKATKLKIEKGLAKTKQQSYLHTGPHHDDIMLGIFPVIIPQLREPTNKFHFSVLTSGFTAVTNHLVIDLLKSTKQFIDEGRIEMINYPNFFEKGYKFKWDKDVAHYLNQVAVGNKTNQLRGICHRITRTLVAIYKIKTTEELTHQIDTLIEILTKSYDGQKNDPDMQRLKGMIREFEEELVWAHYGVQTKSIEHLRLGFYTGDIFTEAPERKRDVEPILKMLRKVQPTIISLTFDPEGSGPDTHYKVLQATAEAIRQWQKEKDLSKLKIVGYRNVWYRFAPSEANVFTPVSLNSIAVLNSSFQNCYISQVNASFPSYEFDGTFSKLSQNIWVEQFKKVQLILGKEFFYENLSPKMRTTHGMIFHKEMTPDEFFIHARKLEKSMEGF